MKDEHARALRQLRLGSSIPLLLVLAACSGSQLAEDASVDASVDAPDTADAEVDAALCDDGTAPRMLYPDNDRDGFGAGEPQLACAGPDLADTNTDCN
ncbi:MAG: hypothetical protein GXP55_13575, partial [Deltaproteobacteria bacterium]|nr:hypothetical protein [Deltaproteobacteria bacterium]